MMVTNLCTIPSSTITLQADKWVHITTVPSGRWMTYWVSFDVNVTGGTVSIIGTQGDYLANKTLLDSIGYFTGGTMPLA